MEHGAVSIFPLLPPYVQFTESIEPAIGALDYPTPNLRAALLLALFFVALAQDDRIESRDTNNASYLIVVATRAQT